uniref:Uncharacterized protein n=1 Tax=Plectus sambesii TaxID=2011161 RepID=A0A914V1C0_9BILA
MAHFGRLEVCRTQHCLGAGDSGAEQRRNGSTLSRTLLGVRPCRNCSDRRLARVGGRRSGEPVCPNRRSSARSRRPATAQWRDWYVSPQRPDRLTHNLPTTRSELEDELHKQQSRLQELHEEVASLRAQNIGVAEKEQELWDVQMVATLLKRKLKSMKQAENPTQGSDKDGGESTEKGPTIEMFEEKQLLAVHMELKEKVAMEKQAIIRLSEQLGQQRRSSANADQQNQTPMDDVESAEWQVTCAAEEKRHGQLLADIIEERCRCARLRAEIELLTIQKRDRSTSIVTRL